MSDHTLFNGFNIVLVTLLVAHVVIAMAESPVRFFVLKFLQ